MSAANLVHLAPKDLRIPDDLTDYDQWVTWKAERKENSDKLVKVPYVAGMRRRAKSDDPETWRPFRDALSAWQKAPNQLAGIGFVFSPDDPFTGIDLDDCLMPNGKPKEWAGRILEKLSDTYAEISPSGTGIKLWTKAKLSGKGIKRYVDCDGEPCDEARSDGAIELYDQDRYFTVTGRVWMSAPLEVNDGQKTVESLESRLRTVSAESKAFKLSSDGKIHEGHGRHNFLVSIAGSMWRRGMSPGAVYAALTVENKARCSPPYDEAHIRQIVESTLHYREAEELDGDWHDLLITTGGKNPRPKAIIANAILALRSAPEWQGVLGFDEFSMLINARKLTPWGFSGRWDDHQSRLTTEWLQRNGIEVSVNVAHEAVQTVAESAKYHPVREYLNSLHHDGKKRAERWLIDYAGAEDTPYARMVGKCWLIGAVARVFNPGCKMDNVLILEDEQGAGKSRLCNSLGGEFYTDDVGELGTKDAAMQIRGRWIIEMGELTSMRTVHVDKIKAFMSRKEDRFRPPYGRVVIEAPRQCVFVGSTNRDEYLHDETGARRFWPVRCGGLRPDDLLKDRDQIWAEALALYRAKVPWWTNDKDLLATIAEEQEARYESDHWESAVLNAMQAIHKKDPEGATIAAIFAEVGKHPLECTEADKRRVGKIARRAKWRLRRSTKPGAHGERRWFYSPAA